MSTVLTYCATCHTHHGPVSAPCPPPGACPDCGQAHCRPGCWGRRDTATGEEAAP